MSGERKPEIPAAVITLFVGVISVLVTINLWVLSDIKRGQSEQYNEFRMLADDVSEFGSEIRLIKYRLDRMQDFKSQDSKTYGEKR